MEDIRLPSPIWTSIIIGRLLASHPVYYLMDKIYSQFMYLYMRLYVLYMYVCMCIHPIELYKDIDNYKL